MRKFERLSAVSLILLGRLLSGAEPGDVEIQHETIRCWPSDRFLFANSTFVPPTDLQTAKLYLRSSLYPDYYFVELTLGRDGTGRAILPMAEAQTPEVVYYVELVTKSFSAFRTEEMRVPVSSGNECQREHPDTAFYNGTNPDITLGATRAGVPQLAPGFRIDGISRFVDIVASSGTGGGGVSGKTVGILAGAGGGAAVALAFLGGSSDGTSTVLGGVTTTVAGSTTTATGGGPSSTTTTATGGGGGPSSTTTTTGGGGGPSSTTTTVVGGTTTTSSGTSTTTTGGSSTTTTGGSSTTTSTGSSTTTSVGSSTTTSVGSSTTTTSGSSTSTSTASSTTTSVGTTTSSSTTTAATTSVTTTTAPAGCPAPPSARANIAISLSPTSNSVRVNGTFSMFVSATNAGPDTACDVRAEIAFPSGLIPLSSSGVVCASIGNYFCGLGNVPPGGSSPTATITVQATSTGGKVTLATVSTATVDPNGSNNSATMSTNVTPFQAASGEETEVVVEAELATAEPHRRARGQVVLNESVSVEMNGGDVLVYRLRGRRGKNQIDAVVHGGLAEGHWRFDFRGTDGFVPGSLVVLSGEVVGLSSSSVVFGVRSGAPPVRFSLTID